LHTALAKYTQITSPYTGVITKRSFHNGDFIRDASQGGSTFVLAVARTDKMRIIVQVPDVDVPYLKVGDSVNLAIDTLPHRHFQGKVARMAYQEAYDTRTMRTEVDLENPDGLLKDGMYGEIIIHLGREKGMRIPSKCLIGNEKDGDVRSVFVVRGGRIQEVKVKIGIDDGIEVTIREGLSASDQIVVERSPGLADGSPVEVIPDSSQEADKEEKGKTSEKQPSKGT
jgi:RND family efflux transporter MFP subunit